MEPDDGRIDSIMDTPYPVMTTRTPALLKTHKNLICLGEVKVGR